MPGLNSPPDPSDVGAARESIIAETAAELAQEARAAASPGRSLGALIRWRYRGRGWSEEACDRLFELGQAELASLMPSPPKGEGAGLPDTVAGRWLTVEEAAALLHRSPESIKGRLRNRDGRRDYGWPWWDGYRWLIPSPAVDPTERASYMATLPEEEPYRPPPFAER